MHVYRLYNSLTLEKYQYDEDLNALFYDGFNADYVVDQIGDLSLFYAEMIDDSDWISPQLIKEILIHFKKNRIIENNVTDDIVESRGPERLVGICIDKGYKFPLNQCFKAYLFFIFNSLKCLGIDNKSNLYSPRKVICSQLIGDTCFIYLVTSGSILTR